MCPDRQILSAYLDGEIEPPWEKAVADHLASCDSCRRLYERMQRTRQALRSDSVSDWRGPMERVRQSILSHEPAAARIPMWSRQVALPLPVAVVAAVLLLALGLSIAITLARGGSGIGIVKVTRAGGTEYQFALPVDKVELLLRSMGGSDTGIESVMTLPKVKLVPVGEPAMGKAAEFLRKKP